MATETIYIDGQTLAQILAKDNKVNDVPITSNNGLSQLTLLGTYAIIKYENGLILSEFQANSTQASLNFTDGTNTGGVDANAAALVLSHNIQAVLSSPVINWPYSTGSRILATDGSNNFQELDTVTYPSLTELAYVKGVTSNIQTQFNNIMAGIGGWKNPARVMAATNITVSSPGASIDSIALSAGDRVLLTGQSTASQNGVYLWNGAASAMTRAADCTTGDTSLTGILGMVIGIEEGTYADQLWALSNNAPISVGSTSLVYIKTSATTYTAGTGLGLTGNQFNITDDELLAIAGLTSAADSFPYFTGSGTASMLTIVSAIRTLLASADVATFRTNAGLEGSATISGTDIDFSLKPCRFKTLSANTTFTFSNLIEGRPIVVAITNTASNYTVTWPTVDWGSAGAPTQRVGAVTDVYTFVYINGVVQGAVRQ